MFRDIPGTVLNMSFLDSINLLITILEIFLVIISIFASYKANKRFKKCGCSLVGNGSSDLSFCL